MSNPLSVVADDTRCSDSPSPWYRDGLRFSCTGCGECCTGSPGYTWLSVDEARAMAAYLKIEFDAFCSEYVRHVGDRLSLKERPVSYDCVFLKDKKCTVYPVRPKQCQTFPWWPEVVESEETWKEEARRCEGICNDADVVPFDHIQSQLCEP